MTNSRLVDYPCITINVEAFDLSPVQVVDTTVTLQGTTALILPCTADSWQARHCVHIDSTIARTSKTIANSEKRFFGTAIEPGKVDNLLNA